MQVKLARSLIHVSGPGEGMWRIHSLCKAHIFSLPENPRAPDSQRARHQVLAGTQLSGATG